MHLGIIIALQRSFAGAASPFMGADFRKSARPREPSAFASATRTAGVTMLGHAKVCHAVGA